MAPRGPGQGGTEPDRPFVDLPRELDAARPAEVVTPLGAYLEAVARLAAEATAHGDLEAARALLEAAGKVVGDRSACRFSEPRQPPVAVRRGSTSG